MDKSIEVYKVVSKIPAGKVMTYGQIGMIIRMNPRLVGSILHKNPDSESIPCHRVVNAQGRVAKKYAFGGEMAQIKKLEYEGVVVDNRKVDLERFQFQKSANIKS